MATEARARMDRSPCTERIPYRFNADQVLRMAEHGIFGEDDVELWDGVLYKMVKGELHSYVVSQVADTLRGVVPPGDHVREEKSCRYGESSLPEPDVAVARGGKAAYLPLPPPLSALALVVEVTLHPMAIDEGEKLRRYAEAGIPVYWQCDVPGRCVRVHSGPEGAGEGARYATLHTYGVGEDFAIVLDGREVGRAAVAALFPPEPAGA